MHFTIISLFPEFFQGPLQCGLMDKALRSGIISVSLLNPRDFSTDKHNRVDDRPYGGGPGMVMLPQPLADTLIHAGFRPKAAEFALPAYCSEQGQDSSAISAAQSFNRLIYLSPKGKPLNQPLAAELARSKNITLLCGRYEGIDARIETLFPMESISIGDFVLNGGESAALCLLESVSRLVPGFMGHEQSSEEESFSAGLLEYPHYTRPDIFFGLEVPEVLRNGHHGKIAQWRRQESLKITREQRPDLFDSATLSSEDVAWIRSSCTGSIGKNLYCALVHAPVLDKEQKTASVSLTNLDIHDIARSSCTFGLGGYYIITPIEDQLRLLSEILRHWRQGPGKWSNPDRDTALGLVHGLRSVQEAVDAVRTKTGREPVLIGTAARTIHGPPSVSYQAIRDLLQTQPVLLLFGTGHGLAPELTASCNALVPPIRKGSRYNHLSVRGAAAITLDRILGDWL